jgi:hypothetical protein
MRPFRSALAIATLCVSAARPSLSQSSADSPPLAPVRQLSLDLSPVGLNVGFALRNTERTSLGVSLGAGGNWYNYMVVAGRHFAESGGASYQEKDGSTDKALFELFRASLFVRRHLAAGRQLDVGVKASGFLHSDSSDDDPGGGIFVGMNVTGMWWQWRRLRLGSELDAGRYSEGRRPEFGINVAPVLVRVTFP